MNYSQFKQTYTPAWAVPPEDRRERKSLSYTQYKNHYGTDRDRESISEGVSRIRQFASDVASYTDEAQKDSTAITHSNAGELSRTYAIKGRSLRSQADSLLSYLSANKSVLSEDAYDEASSFLQQARKQVGGIISYYNTHDATLSQFESQDAYNAAVQQVQDAIAYKKAMANTAKEEELLADMNPTQKMYHFNSGGFVNTETPWSEQVSHAITLIRIGEDEGYELTDKLLKQLNAQKSNVKMNDLTYEKELTELQGYYNGLISAKHADILSKTTMNGTNHSVLKEMELLAQMDPGDEKDKRKDAVLQKMEELDIPADDYALYTDDGNFNWDTFSKWAEASAHAGAVSFSKGLSATTDLLLGNLLQAVGWENNPFSLANEYYGGLYDAYNFAQNLYAERLGGGAGWQYGGDFIEGTVGALPQAIAAIATAGASTSGSLSTKAAYEAGSWLTKAGITGETMMKNPQYWLSVGRTLGTDYEEGVEMGAREPAAALGAVFSSLVNAGIEIGPDGASGIQGLPDDLLSGNKNAFWSWLESGLEEGGEEWLQKGANEIIAKTLYDHNLEISSPLEYARDASIGSLSSLALGGGQMGYHSALNAIDPTIQYINNGISLLQNDSKTAALTAFPNALDEPATLRYNINTNQGGAVNAAGQENARLDTAEAMMPLLLCACAKFWKAKAMTVRSIPISLRATHCPI